MLCAASRTAQAAGCLFRTPASPFPSFVKRKQARRRLPYTPPPLLDPWTLLWTPCSLSMVSRPAQHRTNPRLSSAYGCHTCIDCSLIPIDSPYPAYSSQLTPNGPEPHCGGVLRSPHHWSPPAQWPLSICPSLAFCPVPPPSNSSAPGRGRRGGVEL